eukprot:scaffold1535_cov382-Prasinococcus_capsulatus_cf.AAC.7
MARCPSPGARVLVATLSCDSRLATPTLRARPLCSQFASRAASCASTCCCVLNGHHASQPPELQRRPRQQVLAGTPRRRALVSSGSARARPTLRKRPLPASTRRSSVGAQRSRPPRGADGRTRARGSESARVALQAAWPSSTGESRGETCGPCAPPGPQRPINPALITNSNQNPNTKMYPKWLPM